MHCFSGFVVFFLCAIPLCAPQTDIQSTERLNDELDLYSTACSGDHRIRMQNSKRGRHGKSRHSHPPAGGNNTKAVEETLPQRIAANIKTFIKFMNCSKARQLSTSISRCEEIIERSLDEMRLYMTPWPTTANYSVVIPRGNLADNSSHELVAVLDPFPTAGFGHFVMIFYIDKLSKVTGRRKRIIRDRGKCLVLARKICKNKTICEVDFIPLVYDSNTPNGQKRTQALECLPCIKGFGRCPKQVVNSFLPDCESSQNPQRCNARRALKKEIPRHWKFNQFYTTCDYALTLFGGWNDVTMQLWNEDNLWTFHEMLKLNGFEKDYIKIFYGGEDHNKYMEDTYGDTLCSSDKLVLRDHITTLCQNPFCDSFVIYMNGPTAKDGSILLWDKNQNGKAEPGEIYSVEEFLDDISDCSANYVFVFADHSYSGVLTSSLNRKSRPKGSRKRNSWKNVVLFASGSTTDYSWHRYVTAHWATLKPNQTVSTAYENIRPVFSKPTRFNLQLSQDTTIYGAPFEEELAANSDNYTGCQNLPEARWTLEFDG